MTISGGEYLTTWLDDTTRTRNSLIDWIWGVRKSEKAKCKYRLGGLVRKCARQVSYYNNLEWFADRSVILFAACTRVSMQVQVRPRPPTKLHDRPPNWGVARTASVYARIGIYLAILGLLRRTKTVSDDSTRRRGVMFSSATLRRDATTTSRGVVFRRVNVFSAASRRSNRWWKPTSGGQVASSSAVRWRRFNTSLRPWPIHLCTIGARACMSS